jgi:hypothetical protein
MKVAAENSIGGTTVVLDSIISNPMEGTKIVAHLKRHRSSIRSLFMTNDVFASDGYRCPTLKGLRSILDCLPHLTQLEELELSGDFHLENPHDVKILCEAIQCHPTLKAFALRDFSIYFRPKPGSTPLLDPLLEVVSTSIPNLRAFHVTCGAIYWDQHQCLLSAPRLSPLCRSATLRSLHLSGVRLTDEHLGCLAYEISRNQRSILIELVLNRNVNTDRGILLMVQSLLKQESILRRIEAYNGARASRRITELVIQQLDANHTIEHFHINVLYEYQSQVEFLLLLNRSGRKVVLDPASSMQDMMEVICDAAKLDDSSVIMYFLLANPSILEKRRGYQQGMIDSSLECPKLLPFGPTKIDELCGSSKESMQPCWNTSSLIRSGWWKIKR